jgi:hypothetical protein
MQKSQTTDEVTNYKWEIKVGDEKFELSEKGYQQLMEKEKEGVRLVKIGDKVINPAFIQSAKKIYREEPKFASDFLDWATMGENPIPEPKAIANRQKIMEETRKMIKEKNKDWKPVYKDPVHREAVADVWLHLKSVLSTLEFPIKDDSWKSDPSITKHSEGRESHSVEYKTKIIDLGDKYDDKFWAEANYIYCPVCKKELRKQIVMFNEYEADVVVRNL